MLSRTLLLIAASLTACSVAPTRPASRTTALWYPDGLLRPDRAHARDVAISYVLAHRASLPKSYHVDVAERYDDVEFHTPRPVYVVTFRVPTTPASRDLYQVTVDARSWKAEDFLDMRTLVPIGHKASNQAMQLTASKPNVHAVSVCHPRFSLRRDHSGLAAADLGFR